MPKQSVRNSIWNYLQPVLVGLAPMLVFVSNNADVIKPAWIVRPFLGITLIALCIAFVCRRAFKNPKHGAVVASLIVVLCLSSGLLLEEVTRLLSRSGVTADLMWNLRARQQLITVLALIIQIVVMLMLSLAMSQHPKIARTLATILNIAGLTFLLSSSIIIINSRLSSRLINVDPTGISVDEIDSLSSPDPLPDIYYIILDSYAGRGSLQQEFAFDNSSFLSTLDDHGFVINDGALSNYYRSAYSIASTLNMDYLHDLAARSGIDTLDGFGLSRSIRQSMIRRILSQFDYQTVAFASGFFPTDISDADVYFPEDSRGLNRLENTLLSWTLYAYLLPFSDNGTDALFVPTYSAHFNTISNTLNTLGTLGTADSPILVIAHVLVPHPPFVFDRDGEVTIPPRSFGLDDAGGFPGSFDEYSEGFIDQTIFINQKITDVVEGILATSTRPSIIILQGDHGVRWKCDMDAATCEDDWIAFSILDARLFPGVRITEEEAALSPVNTFRLILNAYFGAQLPYLPDRSFISGGDWRILEEIEPIEFPMRE